MEDLSMSNNDDDSLLAALRRLPPVQPTIGLRAEFAKRARLTSRRHVARWPLAIAAGLSLILGAGWWQERTAREQQVRALRTELEAAIQDVSAARRLVAIRRSVVFGVADSALVQMLAQLLIADDIPNVRLEAARAIGRLGAGSSVADILRQSVGSEESPFVQSELLVVIQGMDQSERDALLRVFQDRSGVDPLIRAEAAASGVAL
jgi:hypothetical protein